jgi:cell division protein FtsB
MRGSAKLTAMLGSRDSHVLPRKLLAVGTGLAVLYLVLLTGQRALEAYRVNQDVDSVRRDIEALRARNIQLQTELSSGRLDEDVERIARDELGMVKPGDQPVVLVWPERNPNHGGEATSPASSPESNWRTWLRLFIDY